MKIGIDISPLSSGHKVRGTGFYLQHLKNALVKYFPENKYAFFTSGDEWPKNVDIIHYPYFDPFLITLPFLKPHKLVVTILDLTPLVFPEHFPSGIKGKVKWQMQRFMVKQADAIITCSMASKKDIIRFTGIPARRIHVTYLAPGEEFKKITNDELRITELRSKYNLPEKFALYVGDVTWNKNLPRLIRAVQQAGVPLVMIGKALTEVNFDRSNAWNKDKAEVFAMLEKDTTSILRLGFIESMTDLVKIYNMATVLVFPSLYEGFGLPVIEAMSCGTPVITTKAASLPEVAGNAAYFVDGEDVGSIAKGIKVVFENSSLQRKLSEKGLQQAKKFTWKKTAEETVDVYKNI